MFTGAWRRSQKLGRRVEARVSSVEKIISCSIDRRTTRPSWRRVPEIKAGSQERSAALVRVPGAIVRAWWCVRLPLEVGCLGFVDRWTRRPSWQRVYQEHDPEFRI